jgi:hypothetical protein
LQSGSSCTLWIVNVAAHDASRLVRNASYRFGYGSTKSGVQRRFSLARKVVRGLRFRFTWADLRAIELPMPLPVCLPGSVKKKRSRGVDHAAEKRKRDERKAGNAENAHRDSKSHERHNRIVHYTVTECPIPAA